VSTSDIPLAGSPQMRHFLKVFEITQPQCEQISTLFAFLPFIFPSDISSLVTISLSSFSVIPSLLCNISQSALIIRDDLLACSSSWQIRYSKRLEVFSAFVDFWLICAISTSCFTFQYRPRIDIIFIKKLILSIAYSIIPYESNKLMIIPLILFVKMRELLLWK